MIKTMSSGVEGSGFYLFLVFFFFSPSDPLA